MLVEANVSTEAAVGRALFPLGDPRDLSTGEVHGQRASSLSLETLSCDLFYDPGSSTVPFAYPPKREELTSCRWRAQAASFSAIHEVHAIHAVL